jgi:hypothetical protein
MSPEEKFAASITVLASTFNRELPAAAIEGYWIALKGLSDTEMAAATARALSECRFMPAPAELLALAGRGRSIDTEAAEAWEAVRCAVDVHDYTDSVDFGPLVNAVVRNLGGWDRLCRLDLEALNVWARKEFERIYAAFAPKDPATLNGDPHIGAMRGKPVPIRIGGKLPVRRIEAAPGTMLAEARGLVRSLADGKVAR